MSVITQPLAADLPKTRWIQLGLGLVAMMAISSPQYVWTLFVKPFQGATGADLPAIQVTFSLLIVLQTWLSPLQGWLVERFGARLLITAGCLLSGLGWVASAQIHGIWGLYLTYGLLCGAGTGIVYVGIVGLMVRWFPDRRGLATGVVAAGYGFGAILTTFPIDGMIKSAGYQPTLVTFGLILGAVGALAALGLREPAAGEVETASPAAAAGAPDVPPLAMLKTPVFWLMFAMMTMMSTGGLMVISQFAAFSKSFGVADTLVLGLAALPFALTFDRITNGLTRPFFGWVSDHIGRETTMLIAFLLEAAAIALLLQFRDNAAMFVLLSGVVFFGWGEIFSLFPSTLTDTFGTRHATTNYGFLYMAQGIGSVLGGPVAAMIYVAGGSWLPVFALIIAMDVITALLAFFVLKPMRRRYLARG
ncbi:oxalate/formate MFS antiporter [Bradyrhizobium sp. U87765 SZCCT0131]|uniref:oxalate/formate MFS antiporter n=1 Tax=unclassified Bradyrhizobium TaxID=2631580 RepID=UPI001BACFCE5|nr:MULTISPECIES: oxalate/formate MFS antiporter [unclassified Bradyrhizobium]MBR1222846.1 oxalate/formate MFS antiporter [Bradyrhizobium sp. U87765 SZCCT0131]MBR1262582.1 oxalate/formate MFS antiporter [Bradyrhizobium sp. U87765 SZCCT0134]MBR1308946.1 oxalate/formate MFS antiporter [Bradyrhizobium sp. U87765 SZCCT0110]MBR1318364.1 oxalate/formate MFS antiporter [Bradyrhizobium sp. U87765 SZCCT0109]MBR1352068.1 oxalate/formate MFS antiporter [Bradyrhizobium sp. U87765 SZCCT0048]